MFGPGFAFGHRRLSILDLTIGGQQPMESLDGGRALVFNGEIYNYVELRDQLARERPEARTWNSDTRVLLETLRGDLHRAHTSLNGMWAFALWDKRSRRLTLSRDRFGVKPLYYAHLDQGLAFSSEPKALFCLLPELRAVSDRVLLQFLAQNRLLSDGESFYERIRVFPQAHFGTFDVETLSLSIQRYWDFPSDDAPETHSDAEACEQFSCLFEDATRIRLRSDVRVGVSLSGGLDSTAVVTAASRFSDSPLASFTSTFGEREPSEAGWAHRAAQAVRSSLIEVEAPARDWLETMKRVTWHMDGPGYSPAVYPLWCLMRRARAENVPVILDGQGADEALGGYTQYLALEFLSRLRSPIKPLLRPREFVLRLSTLLSSFTARWTAGWLVRELYPRSVQWQRSRVGFQSVLHEDVRLPAANGARAWGTRYPARERLVRDHSRDILPGLLHYGDAISMAHGVEVRNPFLDVRLVEWIFRWSTRQLLRGDESKWVLRKYLRARGQDVIAARQDKKGYSTPVASWMANGVRNQLEDLLLQKRTRLNSWCDPAKVRNLIELNARGTFAAEYHLYKLVSTQMWLLSCGDGSGAFSGADPGGEQRTPGRVL